MTKPTRVQFETLPPVKLWIPGPNAAQAGHVLDRIHMLATEAMQGRRYCDDATLDPDALEAVEETLRRVTRPMRNGLKLHNVRLRVELHAQQFAAEAGITDEHNTDAEEADNHATEPGIET